MITNSENPFWRDSDGESSPEKRKEFIKYLLDFWEKVKNGEEPDFVCNSWEEMQHKLNTEEIDNV